MKKILSILLFFIFCAEGYAQLDSSITIFNELRGNRWNKVSGVPDWQIDGYRAKIFMGDTLVRASSALFRAEEVEVYANGSNMSAGLQAAFDYTGIKWISFGSDSVRTYIFDDAINAHGKTIKFENGNKLSGTGTIDSLTVSASDYDYVISPTLTLTNLRSTKGYFTPQNFGAVGNGVADDTEPLKKVTSLENIKVLTPVGSTYYVPDTLILNWSSTIEMPPGSLILGNGITIGSYDPSKQLALRMKTYSVRIERPTQSNWSDTNDVGIKFVNVNHSIVKEASASKFTVGMKTIGYNAGITGMNYTLGFFERNKIAIWISTLNPTNEAWNNENTYYNGYLRNGSENPGQQTFGVWIGNGTYSITNNKFLYQSIELRSNAIPFLIISGSRNQGWWFRSEGNSDTTVKILPNGTSNGNNDFYAGRDGATGKMFDLTERKLNNYNSADRISTNNSDYTTIVEANNLGDMSSYSGTDSSVSIAYPALFFMRANSYPSTTEKGPIIENGALIFKDSVRGGVSTDYLDVSKIKKIVVKASITDTSTTAILMLKMFDKYGRLLGDDILPGMAGNPAYSVTFGGSWLLAIPSLEQFQVNFTDTVKQAIIGFVKTSIGGNVGIKGYKIVSYQAGSASVSNLNNNRNAGNTSPTKPTIGSYRLGKQIFNSNPKKDSAYGWVCTAPGTFGLLLDVTATYANNTNLVVLNSGSGKKVKIGEWLQIGANPTMIIGIKEDSIYLGNRTFGTSSGGAMNYAVPAFEVISYIGATGGGGGEVNTASNYGVGGVGVYDSKNGVDLRFRNINGGNNTISASLDNTNHEVDLVVNPANLTGIPQSGVTNLTDSIAALRAAINSGGSPVDGFAYVKNTGKSVADSVGLAINDSTIGLKSVKVQAANSKSTVTKSGGDTANIYTIDVNAANLTGIPQSGVTNLTDSISALRAAISSGGSDTLITKPGDYLLAGTGSRGYDSTGLFWDKTNKRLGIGGTSGTHQINLFGNDNAIRFYGSDNRNAYIEMTSSTGALRIYGHSDLYLGGSSGSTSVRIGGNGYTYFGGVSSPTAVVDIAAATTARASLRIRDGVDPTSPNGGDIWKVINDFKFKGGGRFYGKLKIDTIPAGSAGTDQYMVATSGGDVKKIPLIPYSDIDGAPSIPDVGHGEYVADTLASAPVLTSFTADTVIYTRITDKVHGAGSLLVQAAENGTQTIDIEFPPGLISSYGTFPGFLYGSGMAVSTVGAVAAPLVIYGGGLNNPGGIRIVFQATAATSYNLIFSFDYKIISGD